MNTKLGVVSTTTTNSDAPAGYASEKAPRRKFTASKTSHSDGDTFMNPDTISSYSPSTLRAEAIRRVEGFVLRTLRELVECTTSEHRLRTIRQQLLVLRLLHRNLHLGVVGTQRDVYYHLACLVPDQSVVNRTIRQLVQLLQMPRQWLGVVPGTRGCVGGSIHFHKTDLRRNGSEGLPLPYLQEELRVVQMDPTAPMEAMCFAIHPETRYIVVLEKHAVFFRLMEERLFERVPCVLLTSHGFPTVAARTLLANMHHAAPHIPVVAVVDYNPSGLLILWQYRHGTGMAQRAEERHTAVHAIRWLGPRSCHFTDPTVRNTETLESNKDEEVGDDGVRHPMEAARCQDRHSTPYLGCLLPRVPFRPFNARDTVLLNNLLARWDTAWTSPAQGKRTDTSLEECKAMKSSAMSAAWRSEARQMQEMCVKVEIEAMYDVNTENDVESMNHNLYDKHNGFAHWVSRALLRRDYI